ncbi:MAG TPA: sigma-70 family RNA polymerase sigma factor [Myxococcota bacterium]|nr:sigma-70 family RNA polymerase sigma factor [Myxococcota bacterium]HRY92313.1 sigma-70 family RNA polymerase sigma factor [Myxococcota bacterium]HSA22731.1 sigma-70 family RNA polymerase sigma factor [Myxococcota bacterium]
MAQVELYRRYAPALLRKGQRLLQSRQDAEDVVQALFLELLARGQTSVDLPYLYRAVTNRALNLLRDRANRARLLAVHDEALRGPARTRCDERAIGLELLCKLIERLDEQTIEVLVYRYIDDLTQEETAELLGVSRKVVLGRLERIRLAVAELSREGSGVSP